MASTPVLQVEGAAKRFGDVQALAGASIEVGAGELVGLLGPNGAGKTTLIKAVAGRLSLEAGVIRLFGRPLARKDPRPELGVVPQELAVYPLLTATENLRAFGALYGVAGRRLDERVRWALSWADLADRANEPVSRFSGGMKRRLNIACSLVPEPSLVLLDEPTVGVDPQSRERIYDMLGALRATGVAIVLTTHHLEEAERRCERIVIIDHGRTVASGTVGDLVRGALGANRTLRVTFTTPVTSAVVPAGLSLTSDGHGVVAPVTNPVDDLATVAAFARAAGLEIADVDLAGASLQDVFISLTGRELRE